MIKYIEPVSPFEEKYEIGNKLVTGISGNSRYIEYDSRIVLCENINLDGINREKLVSMLQKLEDRTLNLGKGIMLNVWKRYIKDIS